MSKWEVNQTRSFAAIKSSHVAHQVFTPSISKASWKTVSPAELLSSTTASADELARLEKQANFY
jgi:hypothetical protein